MARFGRRSRAALAVVSLAAAVAGCGASGVRRVASITAVKPVVSTSGGGDATTCAQTVQNTLDGLALRTYDQVATGVSVVSSIRRLAGSRALAAAVRRNDPAATQAALRPLLRSQIQRIVVQRGSRALADIGHGAALASVHGVIPDAAGAPVGRYTMSVSLGGPIAEYIKSLPGEQVVISARGRTIATTLGGARASCLLRARQRSAASGTRSPRSPAPRSLGVAAPGCSAPLRTRRSAARPRAATVTNTIGAVGRRLLGDESSGAATQRALSVVARNPRFVGAVVHDNPAALRADRSILPRSDAPCRAHPRRDGRRPARQRRRRPVRAGAGIGARTVTRPRRRPRHALDPGRHGLHQAHAPFHRRRRRPAHAGRRGARQQAPLVIDPASSHPATTSVG